MHLTNQKHSEAICPSIMVPSNNDGRGHVLIV